METVLSVAGLAKSYGELRAVSDVSFRVERGQVYGLIGPDGAGKTTTMRVIAGLLGATRGAVEILGFRVPGDERRVRGLIGYMPQQYSLYGDLSVQENLRFFAGMYGVKKGELLAREARLLGIARLLEFRDRPASALSGGMYKKLALACALVHTPKLLLLDEPTNGVDPISRRELWDFLRELVDEGVAVVVSTAYMDEAERCDRVGLIVEGRICADDSPRRLREAFAETVFEVSAAGALVPTAVASIAGVSQAYAVGKKLHVVSPAGPEFRAALIQALGQSGLSELQVQVVTPSFEDIFLHLSRAAATEQSG